MIFQRFGKSIDFDFSSCDNVDYRLFSLTNTYSVKSIFAFIIFTSVAMTAGVIIVCLTAPKHTSKNYIC